MKRCCTCKQEKPEAEFGSCRSNRDGLQKYCKPCGKDRYAKWRSANLESARAAGAARQSKYTRAHPARQRESVRAYQANNQEAVKSSRKKWRETHPDKARESQNRRSATYRANNQSKISARAAKRRADLLNRCSLLKPGDEDKIKALYGFAQWMTERFGTPYHVDHIVPLRGKTCSGLHVPDNLRVVPAQLNLSKGAKIDYELVPHAFRLDDR